MNKKIKKSKKGFTLVELIVVIAIIGVLAMLITPSIMGYVNKSKIQKNMTNAKAIATHAQAVNSDLNNPVKGTAATHVISWNSTLWGTNGSPTGDTAKFATDLGNLIKLDANSDANIFIGSDGTILAVSYATTGTGAATTASVTTGGVTSGSWHR